MPTRRTPLIAGALFAATAVSLVAAPPAAVWWGQWGQNPQHQGSVSAAGQIGSSILANFVYDPFTDKEQNGA